MKPNVALVEVITAHREASQGITALLSTLDSRLGVKSCDEVAELLFTAYERLQSAATTLRGMLEEVEVRRASPSSALSDRDLADLGIGPGPAQPIVGTPK